jgi:transcriptional regulator with XRE-family HTH domain
VISEINKLLGSNIKAHRIRCGLTQCEVADALGYSNRQISHIEKGHCTISAEHLYLLGELFHVPVHHFFLLSEMTESIYSCDCYYEKITQLNDRDSRLIYGLIDQMLSEPPVE